MPLSDPSIVIPSSRPKDTPPVSPGNFSKSVHMSLCRILARRSSLRHHQVQKRQPNGNIRDVTDSSAFWTLDILALAQGEDNKKARGRPRIRMSRSLIMQASRIRRWQLINRLQNCSSTGINTRTR